jgi:hypothetical protein
MFFIAPMLVRMRHTGLLRRHGEAVFRVSQHPRELVGREALFARHREVDARSFALVAVDECFSLCQRIDEAALRSAGYDDERSLFLHASRKTRLRY